jgi:hypothetical protein
MPACAAVSAAGGAGRLVDNAAGWMPACTLRPRCFIPFASFGFSGVFKK